MIYAGVGVLVIERYGDRTFEGSCKARIILDKGFSFCNSLPPIREGRIFHYYLVHDGIGA